MNQEFARYMMWGKRVKGLTNEYKLVENMDGNKETVKAVNMDNWNRYELLTAWVRNWEQNSIGFRDRFKGDIKECEIERVSYEEEVEIRDIEPNNKVRFVTVKGNTIFETLDLSRILVNGVAAMVVYMDECHFTFADKISTNLYGGCFHIDQFAEICKNNGVEISLIES